VKQDDSVDQAAVRRLPVVDDRGRGVEIDPRSALSDISAVDPNH
jgi:hypothetical protein